MNKYKQLFEYMSAIEIRMYAKIRQNYSLLTSRVFSKLLVSELNFKHDIKEKNII